MTPPKTIPPLAWALMLSLSVIWGASFLFMKLLIPFMGPFTIVLGRCVIAAAGLWAAMLAAGRGLPPSPALWGRFAVLAALNNVVPYSLIVFGVARIGIGLGSILNATTPVFAVLVAHFAGRDERLTAGRAVGVALGVGGVAVLVGPGADAGGDTLADLACLAASFIYAFASRYGRKFAHLPALSIATGQMTAAAVLMLPLAALEQPWSGPALGAWQWASLAALGLVCTGFAFLLFFRILALAGSTNVLLVTFLVPVSALLLGTLALHEALTVRSLAGMALIAAGLAAIDGRLARLVRR